MKKRMSKFKATAMILATVATVCFGTVTASAKTANVSLELSKYPQLKKVSVSKGDTVKVKFYDGGKEIKASKVTAKVNKPSYLYAAKSNKLIATKKGTTKVTFRYNGKKAYLRVSIKKSHSGDNHTWKAYKIARQATCTKAAKVMYRCDCGAIKGKTVGTSKGHRYTSVKTYNGKKYMICSVCGHKHRLYDSHDWKKSSVQVGLKVAMLKKNGLKFTFESGSPKQFYCDDCGATLDNDINVAYVSGLD